MQRTFANSPRRPRTLTCFHSTTVVPTNLVPTASTHQDGRQAAFIVPPPALLAVATVSLVALKTLLQSEHPLYGLLRRGVILQRRCHRSVVRFVSHSRRQFVNGLTSISKNPPLVWNPLTPSAASAASADRSSASGRLPELDAASRLDQLRDRAVAKLENERLATVGDDGITTTVETVTNEQFAALPALQRRELLASMFATMYKQSNEAERLAAATSGLAEGGGNARMVNAQPSVSASAWRSPQRAQNLGKDSAYASHASHASFWRVAESVNGRAAALGFMLCLAREIFEPGHPSLFEQVVDVVVPIARSTPPFVVAICDRLVDLADLAT